MTFKKDFLWGGATANQLEGAFDVDGKGLSVGRAMPGGKERLEILNSPDFDWTIDEDKYVYPNHKGIRSCRGYLKKISPCSPRWVLKLITL